MGLLSGGGYKFVHGEAFDAKSQCGEDYSKPPELRHFVQAARNLGL